MLKTLTREDIHRRHGGNVQAMLPTRDGRPTCCCIDPGKNLGFPELLLVGNFPQKYPAAKEWAISGDCVPTYVKRQANEWVLAGCYRVASYSEDPGLAAEMSAKYCDQYVRIVLYLERLPEDEPLKALD